MLDDILKQMVKIPSGKINLRDDRKAINWSVDIAEFCMAACPVTQQQYFAVMGENPSVFNDDRNPVESVSWLDAIGFCNRLSEQNGLVAVYTLGETIMLNEAANGFRLPTEAEWQYACQEGGTNVRYGALDDIAWYEDNSDGKPHNVGQKQPNEWGLYDTLGNVWEWCWDVYDAEVYGSYRIFRGGGWADRERSCLATNRRRSHPTYAIDDLGFRLACNL